MLIYQKKIDINIVNLDDNKHALNCCLSRTDLAKEKIKKHSDKKIITYCAHCTRSFQEDIETRHILQMIFDSDKQWHRISLIKQFKGYFKLFRSLRKR